MRIKWDQATSRTIRVPSGQVIVLIVLLVLAITAIVWVSFAVQGETPRPPSREAPVEGPAAWLGGIGSVLSAVVTGGALLIAALTYRRQIRDRHEELLDKRRAAAKARREQAEAVTVIIEKNYPGVIFLEGDRNTLWAGVRNVGKLPIFGVTFVLVDKARQEARQEYYSMMSPGDTKGLWTEPVLIDGAYATFTDSAGVRWKRWHNGELVEIPLYPKADE